MIFFWLVGGEVTGWCLGILIVNFLVPASLGSMCCGQHMITILYLGRGLSFCIKLKNVHQNVIFLKEELGFYLMAELLFLTCFPLLLHSLTSLISNRLSLLFGTQGSPGRPRPLSTNKKQGTQGAFVPRSSLQCPSVSIPPFLWYSSILREI